jgi:hypothetical protein
MVSDSRHCESLLFPDNCTEDTIYEHKFAPEDVLGLDHIDRSGKARTAGEKAIVIRG